MKGFSLAVCLAALLITVGVAASPCRAAVSDLGPSYDSQDCCHLCPRAADPATYVTSYLQDNRFLIEGHDGWIYRSEEDLRTAFEPQEDEVLDDIGRIGRALKARGIVPVIFIIPPRGLGGIDQLFPADRARYDSVAAARSFEGILERFRREGFIVPDVPKLYTEPAEDGSKDVFFRRDGHWKPLSAKHGAQLVLDAVKNLPVYDQIPHKKYQTKQVGLGRIGGAIALVASAICGGTFPDQIIPKFETTAEASGDDLFGDAEFPSITMVGTSMSANPNYHFQGFLEEAFQADALNVAKSGGSIDGAMTEYLSSDAFLKNPPKLLIWEFVLQQLSLVRHSTFQRVVPRVVNGCAGRDALIENTVKLTPGDEMVDLIYNGGDKLSRVPSKELIVDMQMTDIGVSEVSTEAWFLNGKQSPLRLRYNEFTDAKGRFVFEFSHRPEYADQPLVALRGRVSTQVAAPTEVKVRLCTGDPQ